jgi:uncharacterized protein YjaG (DUF416 family)
LKPHQLQRHLAQLRGWRETAFIMALAERAYPNFALFSQVTEFAGEEAVSSCLKRSWSALLEKAPEDRYAELLDLLEEHVPDQVDNDSYGAVSAVSFCEVLEQALLSQVNIDKRRAVAAGQDAFDAVMEFVEMTEGEGLSDDDLVRVFNKSPLIKRERRFQEELVERLRKEGAPDRHFIAGLRTLAYDDGVSNIGISLNDEDE